MSRVIFGGFRDRDQLRSVPGSSDASAGLHSRKCVAAHMEVTSVHVFSAVFISTELLEKVSSAAFRVMSQWHENERCPISTRLVVTLVKVA